MARQRDYKAEYERRIARGQAAGKTRAASRGHTSTEVENQTRRIRRLTEQTNYGIDLDSYRVTVQSAIDRTSATHVEELLRRKKAKSEKFMRNVDSGDEYDGQGNSEAAHNTPGALADYYTVFMARESFMPVEVFWYHGFY